MLSPTTRKTLPWISNLLMAFSRIAKAMLALAHGEIVTATTVISLGISNHVLCALLALQAPLGILREATSQ